MPSEIAWSFKKDDNKNKINKRNRALMSDRGEFDTQFIITMLTQNTKRNTKQLRVHYKNLKMLVRRCWLSMYQQLSLIEWQ